MLREVYFLKVSFIMALVYKVKMDFLRGGKNPKHPVFLIRLHSITFLHVGQVHYY